MGRIKISEDKFQHLVFMLEDRDYKSSICQNGVKILEESGMDIELWSDMETVKFLSFDKNNNRAAIHFNVPYYDKSHPEKLVATSYNMFTVFEYTKEDAHTSKEIDWMAFKHKFNECLTELYKYCK